MFSVLYLLVILASSSVDCQVTSDVVCPAEADTAPCTCIDQGDDTVGLNCANTALTTERANAVLDLFLQPEISPLTAVWMNNNLELTSYPSRLSNFKELKLLALYFTNIKSIPSGAIPDSVASLSLYFSGLTRIEPDTFRGNYNEVYLQMNSLSRFESAAFQSMMEKMIPADNSAPTGFLEIDKNLFDCDSDPCHLTWLLRDHRYLFSAFYSAEDHDTRPACSNGTALEELDPRASSFNTCPYTCLLYTNGAYANPYSCSNYYICISGEAYPQICTFPLVFNPLTQYCDSAANVPGCN